MKFEIATPFRIGKALLLTTALAIILAPANALALRITSSTDSALSGALVENFDSYGAGYFGTRDFLTGADGFTATPVTAQLHIDTTYCGSFGGSGSCLDTIRRNGNPNDDFDIVFTGPGVSAFGFDIMALDSDWTIETYDTNDVLLNSYTILSQSPALTGFSRRGYFGATETLPIQYFTIRSAGNDRALIDNFAFVPVPEPGSALLAGLGLMGLAWYGGRDRRNNAPTAQR